MNQNKPISIRFLICEITPKHLIQFFLILLFSLASTHSIQGQKWNVKQYDYTDGLGNGVIKCFAQDSLGFLWIGTSNGIFRFDGHNFTSLPIILPDTTILNDYISDIEVARNGNVLIAHGNTGLTSYDYKSQSFENINPESKGLFLNSMTGSILQINDNEFLLGVRKSRLFLVNVVEKSIEIIPEIQNFTSFIEKTSDTNDPFLIISYKGIFSYKNKYNISKLSDCTGYQATFWDEKHFVISENHHEIYSFSESNYQCDKLLQLEQQHYPITALQTDHNNKLWIGTNNGILLYDMKQGGIEKLENSSVSGNRISAFFQDNNGAIWVGQNGGISQYYQSNSTIETASETNELSQLSISKATDDTYLLNSLTSPFLWEWNPKKKTKQVIYDCMKSDSLEYLYEIQYDGEKNWLFFLNGIASFDVNSRKLQRTYFNNNTDHRLHISKKQSFMDYQGKPWFVERKGKHLYRINSQNSIDTIDLPKNGSKYNYSYFEIIDGKKIVYSCDNYINIFKLPEESFQSIKFIQDYNNPIEYNMNIPYRDSILWNINLNGVLKRSIYKDNKIVSSNQQIYQNNTVDECIDIQYNKDHIYILTKNAILKHSLQDSSWVEVRLTGIPIDRFHTIQIIDDTLFLLAQGVHFIPLDNFKQTKEKITVELLQVEINNTPITLEQHDFTHDQNNLHFIFTSIEFINPETLKYRYRINQKSAWKYTDNTSHSAIFSGLKPDKYTFEIQARNSNSSWGPITSYSFTISPPFYLTLAFLTAASILLLSIIYGIFLWRVRGIRKISEMRTRMAELENEALRSQMNPHFIFNSLNSIKSFIIKNKKNEAADYLTQFSILIRTILNNSRQKVVSLSEEIDALNLYIEMENIRLENKFDVEYKIEENLQLSEIQIPPLTLQPFVENAIWHGFIHKKCKGKLLISIQKKNDNTIIIIQDNGVGRKESQKIESNRNRKRSYGIFITKQRLNSNSAEGTNDHIVIEDLYDDNGNSAGTRVRITVSDYDFLN